MKALAWILANMALFLVLAAIQGHSLADEGLVKERWYLSQIDSLKQAHKKDSICIHVAPKEYLRQMKLVEDYRSDTFYRLHWVPDHVLRVTAKREYLSNNR